MQRTALFAVSLLSAAPLFAQTILPKSAATASPGYWNTTFFYGTASTRVKNEGRTQMIYAASELGTIVKVFKSLQVRRPQYLGNVNALTSGAMVLSISNSARAHTAASATFATNHGTKTTVFSGRISLPARSRGTTWPDPWEAAVPFSPSWLFIPSTTGSVVVENMFSGSTSARTWYLEGTRPKRGVRATNFSACSAHSDGGRNNSIGYRFPVVGGTWFINYNNMPSNVPSLAASFQILGAGGVGQNQWGMTLPIRLSSLNLPSNGCSLAVMDHFRLPLTYVTSTAGPNRGSLRGQQITIPNNQQLAGLTFYDQAVCLDTNRTTNNPEIYMSWSSKWTVGSGLGDPVSLVYRVGDNSLSTGLIRHYEAPTIRLNE